MALGDAASVAGCTAALPAPPFTATTHPATITAPSPATSAAVSTYCARLPGRSPPAFTTVRSTTTAAAIAAPTTGERAPASPGISRTAKSAKTNASSAIEPVWSTVSRAQPSRNATGWPNARRRTWYSPPGCG